MARQIFEEYIFASNIQDMNILQDELIALNYGITDAMKVGGDVHVRSQAVLTGNQRIAIDSLIASFVDKNPDDDIPLILDISNATNKHFHAINYKNELSQSLIPKRTTLKGEVIKVEWFKELNGSNVPINPVLEVGIAYNRDASGFAISRKTTRTWFNKNGSEHPEKKVTDKYYFVNGSDQIQEGIKRRRLLVNNIQIPVLGLIMESLMPTGHSQAECLLLGRDFMDDYEGEFNKFVDNSSTVTDSGSPDFGMKNIRVKLRDEASSSHVVWLDKTPASLGATTSIRQYLMEEFNI